MNQLEEIYINLMKLLNGIHEKIINRHSSLAKDTILLHFSHK